MLVACVQEGEWEKQQMHVVPQKRGKASLDEPSDGTFRWTVEHNSFCYKLILFLILNIFFSSEAIKIFIQHIVL